MYKFINVRESKIPRAVFVADYSHLKMVTKKALAMAKSYGWDDITIKKILRIHKQNCKKLHDVCKRFYI